MKQKTKERLLAELNEVSKRVAELERKQAERKQADQALREGVERYRAVVQNTTAVILCVDPQGVIRFANKRALELFGYPADELIGKHAVGTVFPEQEATGRDVTSIFDDIAANPDHFHSISHENTRKNGERVWMEWTTSGIYGADGILKEFLSVGIDATDRKLAEEALRRSESRYRLLHESLRDPFVHVSMDGQILEANDLYCHMLGCSLEEIRRVTYQELTPEYWHAWEDRIVREQIIVRGYSDVYQKEYRRKDGTIFPVELRTILSRDETGQPNGMWAIVRDITDRMQMERELRLSADHFRCTFDQAPLGAALVGLDFRFRRVNASLCSITGYTEDELLSRTFVDITHPEHVAADTEAMRRVLAGELDSYKTEKRYICKDGQVIWIRLSSSLVRISDGRPDHFLALIEDITARRQMEVDLRAARDELEIRVEDRSRSLRDANTALGVLLEHRDKEKEKREREILDSLEKLVFPYIDRLSRTRLDAEGMACLEIISSNLTAMASFSTARFSRLATKLTAAELEVADLLRHGKQSKEIAALLNISRFTISVHRQHIRKKLGLSGRKVNLRAYLSSLS